ncbi:MULTISPECIES: FAD:protein FMN transferase [Idiomarina]|uniref:FAD:protein FMN transferase n=1 Tax=Idiomarina TaxID=135575 RepID=UPI00129A1D45|nr:MULTISPECIES: FAD:protein FMN transferase [Idiomarina]MRJ41141.1 FAD:protein FMN transferase ApbE [Idiomarina sp. FeN1]NCU56306.1 FAD:protein FMN transferase ApbE [Idiomarina sp. FenA--70]NCU59325.1 FAD:protein FMN transferase ApbE [Idiomarina sp. FenBw--71]UUN12501.1 FAD:protein FMN transferase [Idiomarina loihiensis]
MKTTRSSMLRVWLALVGLAFFVSCTHAPQQLAVSGKTMGTTYHISYVTANPQHSPEQVKQRVDAVLEQVNSQMSTYDPQSELSLFNSRQTTEPVVISRSLETVIRRALEIANETDGVLDVTVGPLVNLWGFGPLAKPERKPTEAELQAMLEEVGYQHVHVENHQLRKAKPEIYIDLSTIAKGYGVDRVAVLLEQMEITNYLVEIGGEMRTRGTKPGNQPWRIAIEKPVTSERSVQRVIEPGDAGIATSGDYRNYYEEDGVRYSHIIDPRTGYPIQHNLVSVTVVAPTSMDADAYATALTVMGPERALAFAEQKGLAVLLISREAEGFKEESSTAFKQYQQ